MAKTAHIYPSVGSQHPLFQFQPPLPSLFCTPLPLFTSLLDLFQTLDPTTKQAVRPCTHLL